MKTAEKIIFHWPEMPSLPSPGQPVLIRVATSKSRQAARQELRIVLHQVLTAWSNLSSEQLPLRETLRGPVWLGKLNDHTLDISLSYTEHEGWIGLIRARLIGVDTMKAQSIPETEDIARHYLGETALTTIQQSSDQALAFAVAWTELEARLKCLKLELNEWSATQPFLTTECTIQKIILSNHIVITMAIASKTIENYFNKIRRVSDSLSV